MLAYLFWHTPSGDDLAAYEAGLAAFHEALAADPPGGFARSWSLRTDPQLWLPAGAAHYLDWYLVDGFAALGALNEAAIRGSRRAPHDAVAVRTRAGTAGIAGLVAGTPQPPGAAGSLVLLDKPRGTDYEGFKSALAASAGDAASCWMRQMTLGPGPEFTVLVPGSSPAPSLPWPATTVAATTVAAAAASADTTVTTVEPGAPPA